MSVSSKSVSFDFPCLIADDSVKNALSRVFVVSVNSLLSVVWLLCDPDEVLV